jgi:hypothetical protein
MFKIFEFLGGLMFLVATIQFFVSPRKALQETYDVLVSPSPRIVKGHLILPRPKHLHKHHGSEEHAD